MIKTYKPKDTARVEAMLFTKETADEAEAWSGGDVCNYEEWGRVKTLEGWVDLPYGHYLIKGTNDEFYPCDPDVFENRWMEA